MVLLSGPLPGAAQGPDDITADDLPAIDFVGLGVNLGAQFNTYVPPRALWDVQMSADRFDRLYFDGETAQLTVTIANPSNRALEIDGMIVIAAMEEERDEETLLEDGVRIVPVEVVQTTPIEPFSLPNLESTDITLSFEPPTRGVFGVYAYLGGQRPVVTWLGNVARTFEPQPGFSADSYFMGDTRGVDLDVRALELDTMQSIGVKWSRVGLGWAQFEPQPGVWDWAEQDAAIQLYREREIHVLLLGDNGAGWERNSDLQGRDVTPSPDYYGAWATAWYQAVTRYSDVVRAVNVWNEPWESGGISGWEGNAQHYRNLSRFALQGVKLADPTVLVGGADSHDNMNDVLISDPEWAGLFDLITYHGSDNPGAFYASYLVDLPIWNTESWYTAQLPRTVQQHMFAIAAGAEKVNMVVLGNFFSGHVDAGGYYTPDLENPEQLSPQPNAVGYATMTHFVEGKTFVEEYSADSLPYSFIFENDTSAVAVVFGIPLDIEKLPYWQITEPGTMELPAAGITVYDHYGNPIAAEGDVYVLPFAAEPLYFEAESADVLRAALDALTVRDTTPVHIALQDMVQLPGPGATVDVTITNVLNQPIAGTLSITLPEGWQAEPTSATFDALAPAATQSFSFTLTEATPDERANAYPIAVEVETDAGTAAWSEDIEVHIIACGTPILDGDFRSDWDDLGVVPIIVGDRTTDVYGEIGLAYDAEYLYVMAAVTDRTPDWAPNPVTAPWFELADGNYIYTLHPEWLFYYDNIQLAIDSRPNPEDYIVPADSPVFGRYPRRDTDYLFGFNLTGERTADNDGNVTVEAGEPIVWQYIVPGSQFRQRYPFSEPTQGLVPGAELFVLPRGAQVVYEARIPLALVPELPAADPIGLAFRLSNSSEYTTSNWQRSSSALDVSTFQPYWQHGYSLGTRWAFATGEGCTTSEISPVAPAATSGTGNGLQAAFYDDLDQTELRLTRRTYQINYDWGLGSPNEIAFENTAYRAPENLVEPDTFSVVWTGQIEPLYSETYTFYTITDGTARVLINGAVVVEGEGDSSGEIALTAGEQYDLQVAYGHNDGHAVMRLAWSSPSQLWQIVPTEQLYAPADCCATDIVPQAPLGVQATGSAQSVQLDWKLAAGATTYSVWRGTSPDGPFDSVASDLTLPVYEDTMVEPNAVYYYTVSATSPAGESEPGVPARALTADVLVLEAEDAELLDGPTINYIGGAASGGAQVSLPDDFNAMIRYTIELDEGGEYTLLVRYANRPDKMSKSLYVNGTDVFQFVFPTTDSPGGEITGYNTLAVQVELLPGENIIELRDSFGDEGSVNIDRLVLVPGGDAESPAAPAAVSTSDVTNSSVVLSWAESSDNLGVVSYEVYDSETLLTATAGEPTVQVGDLTPGTTYTLDIVARDIANNVSDEPATITFTTDPTPVDLVGFPDDSDASLIWVGGTEGITYQIERATESGGPYDVIAEGVSDTAYTDTTISDDGTAYYYVVTAVIDGEEVGTTNEASVAPLPGGWQSMDIGNVGFPGRAISEDGSVWDLTASGADIWLAADQFHYLYRPLTGDGEIVALLADFSYENREWAKAGVMIREELTPESRHAMMVFASAGQVQYSIRPETGGDSISTHTDQGLYEFPIWVRIVREGNVFSGYVSPDGETWELIDSTEVEMAETVYIGLALTSHDNNSVATAQFQNVTVTTP
ncbi:MAG: hypothetical protein GYB65_07420 [Chloroflexi bacterium]|nr:hypothetical protein [Chloroflexota bacterium]